MCEGLLVCVSKGREGTLSDPPCIPVDFAGITWMPCFQRSCSAEQAEVEMLPAGAIPLVFVVLQLLAPSLWCV